MFERILVASLAIVLSTSFALAEDVWPTSSWATATPAAMHMDEAELAAARDYALRGDGSGYITRGGRLVMRWGSETERYDIKSSTKSIGVTALGVAIKDGKIALDDLVVKHHPTFGVPPEENARNGWLDKITVRHLVTQTAGFAKPGGYEKLLFEPGTKWSYSDGGPNWLAECITLAYGRDVDDLMFERVFGPLGITRDDLVWRNNQYREHQIDGIARREFGSGVRANVDALARLGYLYLRGGQWDGQEILPRWFVDAVRHPQREVAGLEVLEPAHYGRASDQYGLLWWTNGDGSLAGVPRDAYWTWGLYDSWVVVIPSLDIVVARAGQSLPRTEGAEHYAVLEPFLGPIVASVRAAAVTGEAPYPPSTAIVGIDWAPLDSIERDGEGGDIWPMTWGADDHQYTAYGDAWGFEPRVEQKLSMGVARVEGMPGDFRGYNIRTPDAEFLGAGPKGKKPSGMLMVDGALYMWLRNAANSQVGVSRDLGRSWTWADWKFTESFGAPTFLNFGRNYAGARDEYVYVCSHDGPSAYEAADTFILARTPKDRIMDRAAYEFFAGASADGQPQWTRDLAERKPVFEHRGLCCRSGITYNAGLKRYIWSQIRYTGDARFEGGFSIYEAPEPWGPWSTVFYTKKWDTGPGETNSFPTKWMSTDGRTAHLVFSGDDAFSVRRATFITPP